MFDFALYAFHNAKPSLTQGSGPYIYLPKLESHLEARLWNDVFAFAEETLGLANGTIKATVQIETLPAVFEMDEILYELREHVVALHYSRWDQVFSFVKLLRNNADYQLPDRSALVMDEDFLGAASRLLVTSAHRRGALAIGGLAALVPTGDEQTDKRVKVAVAADHEREAKAGYDGAWVAHPDLVIVAKDAFDRLVSAPNQINTAGTNCCRCPRARLPKRACARTSAPVCAFWRTGLPVTARSWSTAGLRTAPRPRSPAPRPGSNCATARASATGAP